jgi:hypothetical protein
MDGVDLDRERRDEEKEVNEEKSGIGPIFKFKFTPLPVPEVSVRESLANMRKSHEIFKEH